MGTYRGRLIHPLTVSIAMLDTAATSTAGAYDNVFRTVKASNATGARVGGRKELTPIDLQAQVEDTMMDRQRQRQAGNAPETLLRLIFHFQELEEKGLVDAATGIALIRTNARLVSIRSVDGLVMQHLFSEHPNGIYCTEATQHGGLGGRLNLLISHWSDREQGSGG